MAWSLLMSGDLAAQTEMLHFGNTRELLAKHQLAVETKMIKASEGSLTAVQIEIANTSQDRSIVFSVDPDHRRTFLFSFYDPPNTLMNFPLHTHKIRKMVSISLKPGERQRWVLPIAPYFTGKVRERLRDGFVTHLDLYVHLSIERDALVPGDPAPDHEPIVLGFSLREFVVLTLQSETSPAEPGK
jgi:hypothetical protein